MEQENLFEATLIDFQNIGAIPVSEISKDVFKNLAKEFVDKLTTSGCVGLKNHGIPLSFVSKYTGSCEKFFDLPVDVKKKYLRDPQTWQGYTDGSYEKVDYESNTYDVKETFDIASISEELYPKEVPEIRESVLEAVDILSSFKEKIIRILEVGFDLEYNTLNKLHKNLFNGFSTLRALYYPKVPENIPSGTFRCGEHYDGSTFTLQFQDHIGGFQIKENGNWKNADGDPNIINLFCGTAGEILTGGRLKPAKHRVIVANNENVRKSARRCVIFFVSPEPDAILKNYLNSSDEGGISNRKFVTEYMKKIYPNLNQ